MHTFLTAPFAIVGQKFVKPIELSTTVFVDFVEQLELFTVANVAIESIDDLFISTAPYIELTDPPQEEIIPTLEIPVTVYADFYAIHADTDAYYSRVIAAGGSVSTTELTALDREIVRPILAQSIPINEFGPLMGDGLAAAAQKVWSTTALTFVGFTAADYSRTTALTGDGSTKYAKTGFIPSGVLSETGASVGVWNTTPNAGTQAEIYAQSSASSAFGMYCRFNDNKAYFDCSNQTASAGRIASGLVTQGTGMMIGTRISATNSKIYRNGGQVATGTASGGTLPSQELYLWAANNAGTATNFSTKNLLLYFIGGAVTATQSDLLTTYCRNFLTAIGRQ